MISKILFLIDIAYVKKIYLLNFKLTFFENFKFIILFLFFKLNIKEKLQKGLCNVSKIFSSKTTNNYLLISLTGFLAR